MINTSQFLNVSGNVLIGVTQTANAESDGILGFGLLIAVYLIILFPSVPRFGIKSAFATSAFVGFIVALLFRLMSLVNDTVLFGSIVVLVLAVLIIWFSRDSI